MQDQNTVTLQKRINYLELCVYNLLDAMLSLHPEEEWVLSIKREIEERDWFGVRSLGEHKEYFDI